MTIAAKEGLTVTAPADAVCALYPQVPAAFHYYSAIDIANALPPTSVTEVNGSKSYYYADLIPGLYHCAASMEGCCAVCQMLNYTEEKAKIGVHLDMKLDKLAGNGYEAGYVMCNTQEFIDACMQSSPDTWGEAYAPLFQTPYFLRKEGRPGRHQQTTNEELMDFITKLGAAYSHIHIFSLGKSPMYGYDIPLVLFTRENITGKTLVQAADLIKSNGKPTVQYTAQVHSTEPASAEGALAMMLALCGDYGKAVLDAVDVYIVPRINPDGAYEVTRKSPTTGEDMNRDYLRMNNKEICAVTSAYNLFLPEVAIDGHEKRNSMLTQESLCTDMELQVGAGALNHPASMTELAMKMALEALDGGRRLGLRGHFYAKLASAAGGTAGSSYFGTRNSLSFLVETPGQSQLGTFFMERRIMAHYAAASTVIRYTAEHAQLIMDTVHTSREKMRRSGPVYDENDCIVLEHGSTETGFWSTPLIHTPTGKIIDPDYACAYKEHTTALCRRPRATAYLLPQGLPNEQEILRVALCHGISCYHLPEGSSVEVQQYLIREEKTVLSETGTQLFAQGAYVFPNTLPSTILGVIMEPDFNATAGRKMTLLSMGLIGPDENGRLPLFRYCHDLTDGKVTANKQR